MFGVYPPGTRLRSNILRFLRERKRTNGYQQQNQARASPPPPARAARRAAQVTATEAAASTTTSTQPKTPVEQAQEIAERAVLVPVGASLLARDNLVSTVKGLATKYRTRASVERELKRYERRGATARNRFERQVRKTRTRFERELRQRRNRVERTVEQNRRRLEREVRSVRQGLREAVEPASARARREARLRRPGACSARRLQPTSPAGAQESAGCGKGSPAS